MNDQPLVRIFKDFDPARVGGDMKESENMSSCSGPNGEASSAAVDWEHVKRCDPRAREIADRHYSRQTPGAVDFMPPGKTFVLYRPGAVWGVVEHLDPRGNLRWRCSIFRNESGDRASVLIASATVATLAYWARKWGGCSVPLTTEAAPSKVRPKADPGHCFIIAGWRVIREVPPGHGRPGHRVLVAPPFARVRPTM